MLLKFFRRKRRCARFCKFQNLTKILGGRRPLRRVIISKVVIKSPKKPHSGKRPSVKFWVPRHDWLKNFAYIGQKDGRARLKQYDTIYVRGSHRRDIPAMKYAPVFGCRPRGGGPESSLRGLTGLMKNARSKYGAKNKK